MTLRDTIRSYFGWCPRFNENPPKVENPAKQLLTNIRLWIPKRVLILLVIVVAVSLFWIAYLKTPSDVNISDIKITKDNMLIYNVSFDKPLNVTAVDTSVSVDNPDHVRVVSDDKCPSGFCLGMEEGIPLGLYPQQVDLRGSYQAFLANVTGFDVFNVSWIEKQSSQAKPEIWIEIWNGNDFVDTEIEPYYRGSQPIVFFDTGFGNATSSQLYNYSVSASLTDWTRFSIVIDRERALVAFYVDGVVVGSRAISSGFRGNHVEVSWTS